MAVQTNDIQPGPYSRFRTLSLMNVAQTVKAGPGRIYEVIIFNAAAATRFVKFYDKATAPTVGTDVPVYTLEIDAKPNGQFSIISDMGWEFVNGIYVAATNVAADNDNTAPTALDIILHVQYK